MVFTKLKMIMTTVDLADRVGLVSVNDGQIEINSSVQSLFRDDRTKS